MDRKHLETHRPSGAPVVVTGMGAVSAWGAGLDPLRRALRAGRCAIGEFDRFSTEEQRTRLAGQVPLAPLANPIEQGESIADRFAVAAALEAVANAGFSPLAPDEQPLVGVYFGSSTGAMLEAEQYFARLTGVEAGRGQLRSILSQEYNGPGDAVAREVSRQAGLVIEGPIETHSTACASGTLALGAALDALREGEVDIAIAGGSDSLCQLTYSGFNSLRALDEGPCRPFRGDRAGLSLGEGAAVLVLEGWRSAKRRGATLLGGLAGAGAACDAHHMTAPKPQGEGAAEAMRAALREAGLRSEEIDFINAHGTGTPHNDRAEWNALRQVFGDRAREIPLTSTKGSLGHLLGSAGAIEAVATLLALRDREVHPTPGGGEVDPALGVRLVLGEPLSVPEARYALSTSLAFGGSNAAVILTTPEACR